MTFRSGLFWVHLTAGLVAGTVIMAMSVTGTLLAFQQSVLRGIERSQRYVEVPPGATALPLDDILARVKAAIPEGEPGTITFEADPARALAVAIGPQGTAFVNPYTGEVLGTGSARARGFYRTVTNWHRYLALSGDNRAIGKAITGACNAAFLVLAVSGLYLWLPRQWTMRHVAAVAWFRGGLRGKARDFNWHNTIGLWCAPVLVVLATTGMVISYAWASNLVYTVTGSPRPVAAAARPGGPGGGRGGGAPAAGRGGGAARADGPDRAGTAPAPVAAVEAPRAPTSALFARAAAQVPTWSTIALRLPARPGASATATISDGAHWNRFARSTLTIDGRTGAALKWEPYAASSAGQKLRGWMRFAHTGELGGLAGEAAAGLACVGGAFLVWTGMALSLRRFAAWRARLAARAVVSSPLDAGDLQS